MFGFMGISARTDYLVSGPSTCTLLLTGVKADGEEGRVFCARTTDGGQTLTCARHRPGAIRLRHHARQPAPGPDAHPVRGPLLRAAHGEFTTRRDWIDLYASDDDAATWAFLTRPVPDTGFGGNPPTLTRLQDGRICMTYGYRAQPFGIRARLSADEGLTWDQEVILRDDGGSHDLGYPRTIQRPDGTLVTVVLLQRPASRRGVYRRDAMARVNGLGSRRHKDDARYLHAEHPVRRFSLRVSSYRSCSKTPAATFSRSNLMPTDTNTINLTQATIWTPPGLSGPEQKAVDLLRREVEKRTNVRWPVTTEVTAQRPVIRIGSMAIAVRPAIIRQPASCWRWVRLMPRKAIASGSRRAVSPSSDATRVACCSASAICCASCG